MKADSLLYLLPVEQLSESQLLHLLRRTLLFVDAKDFELFRAKTLDECLSLLLQDSPLPDMIVQTDPDLEDPDVPRNSQWVNAPFGNSFIDSRRGLYLKAWWTGRIMNRDVSVSEKMTLFWNNYFPTSIEMVGDARYSFRYAHFIRKNALGNAKEIIREGSKNVAMLVYLNGNTNHASAPNENYGRELLELFTLGQKHIPNYSEQDVKEAARILTGWRDDKNTIDVYFDSDAHDNENKVFSNFFGNQIILGKSGKQGAGELDELIEMLFNKEEVAHYLAEKLYRFFVNDEIDEIVKSTYIAELAKLIIAYDYEIKPILYTLLSSAHFFDPGFQGGLIKTPVEYCCGVLKHLKSSLPENDTDCHLCWIKISDTLQQLGMCPGEPPSVAGWKAFYQNPNLNKLWINASTLGARWEFAKSLTSEEGLLCNGTFLKMDLLKIIEQLPNPQDATDLLENLVKILLSRQPSPEYFTHLLHVLNGMVGKEPDWASLWQNTHGNKVDSSPTESWEYRMTQVISAIIQSPQYQMI